MGAKVALASSSSKTSNMKKIRPIGTAAVLPRDTELQLVKWVNEYRVLGAPVLALMLHFKALDFAEQAGLTRQKFAASWAWRKGFIKRHRLGFRARTRQGQHSQKFDAQEVCNADQTPIFFEYVPKRTPTRVVHVQCWFARAEKTRRADSLARAMARNSRRSSSSKHAHLL
ncbi:hypothetical protein PF002_g2938 [Phytophthora fragariae]|uniref:HTH CENPB-type domain-containing protein n=1 Tax=Phytophthora fragariae TaxID=53985 RepID=A0A6A4DJE4_9STRA|nr:hypothetical protein PF006_g2120 [Phytophthora fragariae]KAE9254276.1 hypothetical protein PF002_g2938 [Phytophthora fragariae]KAE9308038.1 hypothetical protein PF001_g11345 [Phytophthora fragariae]